MSKYQVGDVLRIRQWDDMANEFGYTNDRHDEIKCLDIFVEEMKYLCGKTFTVANVSLSRFGQYDEYTSVEHIENGWAVTEDMLEPYYEDIELDDPANKRSIDEFLSTFQQLN